MQGKYLELVCNVKDRDTSIEKDCHLINKPFILKQQRSFVSEGSAAVRKNGLSPG